MIEKLKIVSFAMIIIGIILFLATPIFLTLWNLDTDLIGLTIAIAGVILYGILKLIGDRWKGKIKNLKHSLIYRLDKCGV